MEEELQQHKEVNVKDLRMRVNSRAEKMIKTWFMSSVEGVLASLVVIVLVFVFPVLNHWIKWIETDWTVFAIETLIIVLFTFIVVLLLKHFLKKMKNAYSVSQQCRAAKQFIKTIQWGCFLLILLPLIAIDAMKGEEMGGVLCALSFFIIVELFALYFKPDVYIDKDFYNDVEELDIYE
ncbi:MAG: hypothetical protein IJK41_12600 [Muribaculaceae bacterium]|nr:hypothetical protein [Muribaculaceae bacterium]